MAATKRSKNQLKKSDKPQQAPETIGGRFKALRLLKGYSSAELFAYTIEMDRKQYQDYERGKDMKMTTFLRLCRAFEISPEDFFKGIKR
jgi:transcriptional regulator with XRE-family HTH domain